MSKVGRIVKFTAREGQRDALVEHLVRAAQTLADVPGCRLYLVNTSPSDPNGVWVVETWDSQADIDASLATESARAAVKQVLPLVAGPPERVDVLAVGGKGLG